ncbi:hypothetical protein K1719_009934 [Acacia pycnantha]|nr:hypothetical protein K1719_009934 [Acacia pycnantha]
MNALTGGPWMLYDHYLTVKPWEANFKPDKAEIDTAAVWVRLPKKPQGGRTNVAEGNPQEQAKEEQWRIVQKVRQPRKQKEKAVDLQKQHAGGSRFGVLADTTVTAEETMGSGKEIIHEGVITDVVVAGKVVQNNHIGVNGGSKRRNSGGAKGKKQNLVMEEEDKVKGRLVLPDGRRAEKRAREVSDATRNEVLMLTMGEGEDDENNTRINPGVVKPVEDSKCIDSLEIEPGGQMEEEGGPDENMNEEVGPVEIVGPVEEDMGVLVDEVEEFNDPCGDMELSMVPETPL